MLQCLRVYGIRYHLTGDSIQQLTSKKHQILVAHLNDSIDFIRIEFPRLKRIDRMARFLEKWLPIFEPPMPLCEMSQMI
jgi:hypothetical protein